MFQEVVEKTPRSAQRRELVDDLRLIWQVSIRHACAVLRAS